MNPTPYLLTTVVTIICISLFFLLRLRKRNREQSSTIQSLLSDLEEVKTSAQNLQQQKRQQHEFKENLSEAEITTRLQEPRLASQQSNYDTAPPERYQYVRTLIEKKMSTEEICAVLSISVQEAEQLIALASLVREK